MIHNTLKVLEEQQEYFFEMLWKKAVLAKQRIKEIEENLKRIYRQSNTQKRRLP
jgi:two-component system sensor histidine kinase VicK